jgi:thiol-disulfide isomerase/thioredoxin
MTILQAYSSLLKRASFAVLVLSLCLAQASWAGDGWSLKDKDGAKYSLSGLHGKWVLVNFWAPWCTPCLQEMSDLVAIQQQYKDLQVIGVAVMYGSRKEVMDIVNKKSISYPIVFGNEDIAGDFGGLTGIPTSFLYSPAGKLVGHLEGPVTQADIGQRMR